MTNIHLLDQVIASIKDNTPVSLVNSPPGAGKSRLIVDVIDRLAGTGLSIAIVAPTRQGVTDLATNIHNRLGTDSNKPRIHAHLSNAPQVEPFTLKADPVEGAPYLTTVASMSRKPAEVDLLIVDEAYQSTFASICQAGDRATQLLMVGDPGQIGPVVRSDAKLYARQKFTPAGRAPEVFLNAFGSKKGFVKTFSLHATYRLGQATVNAIAPLYDFPFTSARPDRFIAVSGRRSSEIVPLPVESTNRPDDQNLFHRVVADIQARIADSTFVEEGSQRRLTQTDIAVVVSHNVQEVLLGSLLNLHGLEGITVGTADSLQGAQWPLVYSIDPMIGHEVASAHQLSPGRLCVMASRHMGTVVWVHDDQWKEGLRGASASLVGTEAEKSRQRADAELGIRVRAVLTGERKTATVSV
ncbi:AAA family ATPase [Glutamicibacter ardleyensis]|uniref:AAA family ATPase n=1 Tax=Glutamicibacter ardleyensis TaxID=225894 RepID=UPI003FD41A9C